MPSKPPEQNEISKRWQSLIETAGGLNHIRSEKLTLQALAAPRQYLATQLPQVLDRINAKTALEIAGGAASNQIFFGKILAEKGVNLTFTDIVDGAFPEAQQVLQRAGINYTLQLQDVQALTYPEATFDVVFCSFAMCTFPDLGQALSEIYRVLRPGGVLVCIEHVQSENGLLRVIQTLTPRLGDSQSPGCEWNRPIPHGIHEGTGFNFLDVKPFPPFGIILTMIAQKPLDSDPSLPKDTEI